MEQELLTTMLDARIEKSMIDAKWMFNNGDFYAIFFLCISIVLLLFGLFVHKKYEDFEALFVITYFASGLSAAACFVFMLLFVGASSDVLYTEEVWRSIHLAKMSIPG